MQQDIATKALEEYNEVYAEIFNEIVFGGEEILKEDELRSLPTSAVVEQMDGRIHEYFRDIRKADQHGQEYILITAIENQADIDCSMPVRVMGYEFSSYMEQIKRLTGGNQKERSTGRMRRDQRIAPAITVVLYWGTRDWQHPSRLYDILDFSNKRQRKIQPFVNDYRIHVIAMRRLPAEVRERLHGDLRGVAEYISEDRNEKERYERMQADHLTIRHPAEFLTLIGSLMKDETYIDIKNTWVTEGKQEEVKMSNILEMAEEIGRKQGIEQGMKQGMKQGIVIGMRTLMERNSCSAEEAVDAFQISQEERRTYLNLLEE